MKEYFIVGGAGFIGSHLVRNILNKEKKARVVIYDNFTSGKMWHLEDVKNDRRLKIIKNDIKNLRALTTSMKETDVVYHFASNPDIAKAMIQPDIDFWEGTYLTNNVLEAMRINKIKKILYASGSGVYGDTGYLNVEEDYPLKLPISTYGASKLGCEALICSYCYLFGMEGVAFRFANVVGPNQTHGVGFDFIKRLLKSPTELLILGDGSQSKSYIYIDDVISALRRLEKRKINKFEYYNVSTLDYINVKEIADIVIGVMGLKSVNYKYTGGKRGWKGDVPIIRLNSRKIRKSGWKNKYNSREAIYKSIESMYGKFKLK